MSEVRRRTLHVFPFSHFSEKGMWILDYKGVSYEIRAGLDPFVRQRTARLTGGSSTLPVLEDGGQVIPDSTDLALYADKKWPEPRLIPLEEPARADCLLLEDWADEIIGDHARRWLFAHVLYDEPQLIRKLLKSMHIPSPLVTLGFPLGFPLIKAGMTTMLGLNEKSKAESADILREALETLNKKLEDRAYLVGDAFTLADLAVCALLSPLCDRPSWKREFPDVFAWRADICERHHRRKLLTDPIPSATERRRFFTDLRATNEALSRPCTSPAGEPAP